MHPDLIGNHKLHPSKPYPVGRQPPPTKCGCRIGQVEHDLGFRARDRGYIDLLGDDLGDTLVDESLVSFGAGDRDVLFLVQHLGGIPCADDRRKPKLPADDGGVGRAPPAIRDDRCCPSHDRHPVGIGGGRHQHRAWHEAVDILGIADHADWPRDDVPANA